MWFRGRLRNRIGYPLRSTVALFSSARFLVPILLICVICVATDENAEHCSEEKRQLDMQPEPRVAGWALRHDPPFLGWGASTNGHLKPEVPVPCNWRRLDMDQLPDAWLPPDTNAPALEPLLSKPAMVRGMQTGWAATRRWTRAELLRRYGNATVQIGDSLEMGRAGPEASSRFMTLRHFVDAGMRDEKSGQKLYSFDRTINIAARAGDDHTATSDDNRRAQEWQHLTLNIGPSGEGLGFHYHDAAINAVVHGAKRWWACPNYENMSLPQFEALKIFLGGEETGFGQDIRMADWLEDVYPRPEVQHAMIEAGVVECIAHAGETAIVPPGWHHAVVNLGETIALAVQRTGPGGPFEGAMTE